MADKFYVYQLFDAGGVKYVGKGSGRRFEVQKRNFGMDGEIVKTFPSENAAYAFERQHISAVKPELNKCAGGNGSRVVAKRKPICRDSLIKLCDTIGTKRVAAMLALCFPQYIEPSKVEQLRQVAYG
jgi:hypothetical protein